ncbi:hypothetical protein C1N61_29835 (plasmid) [Priestia aryabhattai]
MHKPNIKDFKHLVTLMEEDSNGEVEAYQQYQNIYIRGDMNELMIRDHKPSGNLVIAQIELIHKEQKTRLEILKFLTNYGKENGYSKIIAESVYSPEYQKFFLENHFKEKENKLSCYEPLCYELSLVD